ncbi:MAG TPA: hypothetical protein VFA56_13630 [Gaiellaceae bacterium]|nr:hypothetical protein [Gaiellaceae bacterium]
MHHHPVPAAEDDELLAKLRRIPAGELRDRVEREWRAGDGARETLRAFVDRATFGPDLDLDRLARLLDEAPIAFVVSWGWPFGGDEGERAFTVYASAAAEVERLRAAGVENVRLGVAIGPDATLYLEEWAA